MKDREEFEGWTRKFYSDLACASDTWSDEKGTYTDYAHHMAWHLWQELQSRLEELNRKVEGSEKENASLKQDAMQHYLEALPAAWIHFPPKKAELARVDFYPQAKTKEIGSGWITVPLYKETNA